MLTGQGSAIATTSAQGKLVFGIFAAPAEFERELISERTIAGLGSVRARGCKGGTALQDGSGEGASRNVAIYRGISVKIAGKKPGRLPTWLVWSCSH
ncbi:recombinase family protein [Corynebacterium sp. A21]|uniref:recombinase family protein n=1 Tax=Corynebacterium sp. A21 TaxID=3457318 RepID=UPI003FD22F32